MNKRFGRLVKITLIGAAALAAALVGLAYLIYPAEFVNRVLRWGDADVYDYQKFPARNLLASEDPFEFSYHLEEQAIQNTFEQVGEFDDLDTFLDKNRTQAFLVIQNDTVLYEEYFNGASRESIVTSFSIAKSFTSALIGVAISEGHIKSVNDPITQYLPELLVLDPDFARIKIRDLLMMSSGIKYSEPPDDALTYYHPDLRSLALEKIRINGKPGEEFHYNNFHPLLLGMILERATGVPVAQYLGEKIWQPAGMEYTGSWSLDENGFEKMESGINARAVDFAKFGRLYLGEGYCNGKQIIPKDWVLASTQPVVRSDYFDYYYDGFIFSDGSGFYQNMWWGIQYEDGDVDIIALGNHGQFIYLSPAKDLMILRFGETYGEFGGAEGWVDLFKEFSKGW